MDGTIDHQQFMEPTVVEMRQDSGEIIRLREAAVTESFRHFLLDLPEPEKIKIYRFTNEDMTISFHYAVHSGIGAIIAPPNGIKMEDNYKKTGIGNQIQFHLEDTANKYGYRLMAGLTMNSAAAFNQRVVHILRGIGYHIGPPSDISEIHYCIHDSTYDGNGIPEISGMTGEYFIPPTNTKNKN